MPGYALSERQKTSFHEPRVQMGSAVTEEAGAGVRGSCPQQECKWATEKLDDCANPQKMRLAGKSQSPSF